MTFSAPGFFVFFLPLSVLGFALFGSFGRRSAVAFLAFMSLVFYAEWSVTYLWLLIGSILFNFCVSHLIARNASRERVQTGILSFGIAANLAALGYFKYLFPLLNFFAGHGIGHNVGSIILPLGISFFTFTQIAYLVDLKQGAATPENLLSYFLFVTYFPHLIAGPILHHKEIMPQFREERRYGLNRNDVALGLSWFAMGMFKKVMIADRISAYADSMFHAPRDFGFAGTWAGVLCYAMQLYFDFSGYSDMAVGLARVFSIRFPLNFDSPYKATGIIDFWNRWHMTLTRYITAYVYSPIIFWISRRRMEKGKKSTMRARATLDGFTSLIALPMLFTLFLAGVWHGAGLQYLLYGLMHGTYIVINHAWRTFLPADGQLRRLIKGPVAVGITFICVLFGEVMFRAAGAGSAISIYAGMLGRHHGAGAHTVELAWIVALLALVWLMPNTQELLGEEQREDAPNWNPIKTPRWQPNLAWWLATTCMFLISMAYCTTESTFLYFQF
ncbi:MBOAT family O-acyltransferase [Tunturiibacter lichenicola]|uniref:MBOAT family O-acyltransferase n=1 Tax=Tunturiibacter lichenicola TaxID=2051959 RepID=UPI003D9B01CD